MYPRKGKTQKSPKKVLSLHLRIILGSETACSNRMNRNNQNKSKKEQTLGKGENLISRVTTLLFSSIQSSAKYTKHTKKQKTMAHSKGKKNEQKLSPRNSGAYSETQNSQILKSIIIEVKNSLQGFKGRLKRTEEKSLSLKIE